MNEKDLESIAESMKSMFGANSPMSGGLATMVKGMNELNKIQALRSKMTKEELDILDKKLKADEEYANKIKQGAQKIGDGSSQLAGTLLNAVKSMGSMSSSIAQSDQSFAAMVPVAQMVGNTFKGLVEGIAKMAGGITILGTGFSGVTEGLGKLAGVAIDMATQAMVQQLERTQQLVNNFQQLSKAGVTFGGNLDTMTTAAHEAGMGIATFAKFVSTNIDSLSTLGGSVSNGAAQVGKLSKAIQGADEKLLEIYGSYDALNGGLADYMAMLQRSGIDTTRLTKEQTAAGVDYLYNLKLISDITGKSAEAQKKEQEEREKNLAWQQYTASMSEKERVNVEFQMQTVSALYGKGAMEVLQEMRQNNGEIYNSNNLMWAQANPLLFKEMQEMQRQNANITGEEFKRSMGSITHEYAGQLKKTYSEDEFYRNIARLKQAGVSDDFINMITEAGSKSISTFEQQDKLGDTIAKNQRERDKELEPGAKVYKDTIDKLEAFKIGMDDLTRNHLKNMGPMMDTLYDIAKKSAGLLDNITGWSQILMNSMDRAVNALLKVLDKSDTYYSDKIKAETEDTRVSYDEGATLTGEAPTRGKTGAVTKQAKESYKTGTVAFTKDKAAGLGLQMAPGGTLHEENGTQTSAIQAAALIQELFGDEFGGFTSIGPRGKPTDGSSYHTSGQGLDFILKSGKPTDKDGEQLINSIKSQLKSNGLKILEILDEYNHPSSRATGGHFHVAVDKLAKGGKVDDLAIVGENGPELMSNGQVTSTSDTSQIFKQLNENLEAHINIAKDQRDLLEKILWHQG
jgi:hypothetical protein